MAPGSPERLNFELPLDSQIPLAGQVPLDCQGPLDCQVLVVGAGPSGSRLATALARAGLDVVLIDRLSDLRSAAFSSAALPMAAVRRFGLPERVVASLWSGWQLVGPDDRQRHWQADQPQGAVLDFGGLRQWLAAEANSAGARLLLGWRAQGCHSDGPSSMQISLLGPGGQRRCLTSGWVVDASGESRSLLGKPPGDSLVSGVGVEWLLQVSDAQWHSWSDRLNFFLGSSWVQQGYGWIFPMAPGQLKLGVCRLLDPGRRQPALAAELQQLLARTELSGAEVLDRHGGRISSTINREEPHGRGRLLGLGDAVSTANLLGGEGIRHALLAAELLAPLLIEAVRLEGAGQRRRAAKLLRRYPIQLRRALGWRWNLSGRLARRTWLSLADQRSDRRLQLLLKGLEQCRAEDLSALLFDYRFERYGFKALPYLLGWR